MVKLTTYSAKGIKKGAVSLPSSLAGKENLKLLAQAVRVYENRSHPSTARVKTRGEVKLSTRKIYRQKGTGNARHGAKSAPIFVGGGVAHGPKGIKRELNLSKKIKKTALKASLSVKVNEKRLFVVDGVNNFDKTKSVSDLISKITEKEGINGNFKVTFALSDENKEIYRKIRNIKNVSSIPFRNLNAFDVYKCGILIIDKKALEEKVSKKASREKPRKNFGPKSETVTRKVTKKEK